MRFATGDEVGVFKVVDVEVGTDTARSAAESAQVKTHKRPNRQSCVQVMTFVPDFKGAPAIALGRKGHIVEVWSFEGMVLHTWRDDAGEEDEDDAYVCMETQHTILTTCTARGRATFRSLNYTKKWYTKDLGGGEQSVSCLRMDPDFTMYLPMCPGAVAVGGKENDLTIWENNASNCDDMNDVREYDMTLAFEARNVKDDELSLRVPVWVSDIQFIERYPAQGYYVAVCTRYRHVRIYDADKSRRPVISVEVGDSPLVSMLLGNNWGEFYLSDSHGKVFCYSTLEKRILYQFKGGTGAVTGLASKDNTLATVSLDRYLRAYDTKTHEMTAKVFLETKMTSVAVLESAYSPSEHKEDKEEEEEDVLRGLEDVEHGFTNPLAQDPSNIQSEDEEDSEDDSAESLEEVDDYSAKRRRVT